MRRSPPGGIRRFGQRSLTASPTSFKTARFADFLVPAQGDSDDAAYPSRASTPHSRRRSAGGSGIGLNGRRHLLAHGRDRPCSLGGYGIVLNRRRHCWKSLGRLQRRPTGAAAQGAVGGWGKFLATLTCRMLVGNLGFVASGASGTGLRRPDVPGRFAVRTPYCGVLQEARSIRSEVHRS